MKTQIVNSGIESQPTLEKPLLYVAIINRYESLMASGILHKVRYERDLKEIEKYALAEIENHEGMIQSIDICIVSKTIIGKVRFERVKA